MDAGSRGPVGGTFSSCASVRDRFCGSQVNLYGTVRANERTTSAHCRFNAGGALSCDNENYLGAQYMGLSGVMKQNCIRITGEAQYRNALNGQPTGSEYRVAMIFAEADRELHSSLHRQVMEGPPNGNRRLNLRAARRRSSW